MALKHHTDSDLRISQQVENSENYVLAFINETYKVVSGLNVLGPSRLIVHRFGFLGVVMVGVGVVMVLVGVVLIVWVWI